MVRSGLSVLVGLIGCLSGVGAFAEGTLDRVKSRQEIKVGVMLSGGPFGALNPSDRQPQGLNVDIANEVGKVLGVKVELVSVLPANRIQFLQQGKVDLLVANMELNEERGKILGHVPTPFYKVGGAAIFPKTTSLQSWSDLKSKPVCTSQGSSYVKPLTELGADIKAFKSSAESLLALRGGNCIAAVHDSTLIEPLQAKNPEWKDYRLFAEQLNPAPSVIWTRKGDAELQGTLDAAVKGWHRTGWLVEAERRNGIKELGPEQFGL